MIFAAQTAGLNVLRLFNDTAAIALAYGIYKQVGRLAVVYVTNGATLLCLVAVKKAFLLPTFSLDFQK